MKVRKRDYVIVLFDIFIGRPLKRLFVKAKYFLELGGKGGYEIHGAPKYWGRYGTPEKIVELVSKYVTEEDDISFYLPAAQYDLKYSHKVNIWGTEDKSRVLIEFIYSSDQCGSYEKIVSLADLLAEVHSLETAQLAISKYGYSYEEY